MLVYCLYLFCSNTCACEDYPLLRTINRELRGLEQSDQECSLSGNYRYMIGCVYVLTMFTPLLLQAEEYRTVPQSSEWVLQR